jgi:hypothetical protein
MRFGGAGLGCSESLLSVANFEVPVRGDFVLHQPDPYPAWSFAYFPPRESIGAELTLLIRVASHRNQVEKHDEPEPTHPRFSLRRRARARLAWGMSDG